MIGRTWVKITAGPDWSIGLVALHLHNTNQLVFDTCSGDKTWRNAEAFTFQPLNQK